MGSYLKRVSKKHQELFLILSIATVLRILLASSIELGNDEVYYWTYVKYPDISHFDHPPMLGYFAQLFTFNLFWDSELALRFSAIFCGILSTVLIYLITKEVRNKRAAIYAAILFSASLYASIISSLFLMPDNPLMVFWLAAIYCMFLLFKNKSKTLNGGISTLLGVFIGLATLSKYQGIFLALGFVIAAFHLRKTWFKQIQFYMLLVIAIIIASPILWWNWENDFVSFGFHSKRVGLFENGLRLDYFFSELFGEILYNNPINVALIVVALIGLKNGKWKLKKKYKYLFLHLSWPLILTVLSFALFKRTLPHWTGPAYTSLMIIAAVYLSTQKMNIARRWYIPALSFIFLVTQLGAMEINQGIITASFESENVDPKKKGKYDVTLDMFGWRAFKGAFEAFLESEEGIKFNDLPMVSQDLYQSAHFDYYVARPLEKKLIAFGPIEDVHKYAWINLERDYIKNHSDALFITHSRAYKSETLFVPYFEKVEMVKQIPILRNGTLAENYFVFYLENYKGNYPFPEVKY
tara:strand:+ start:2618 stop:4189 length:1572 start_codon:yes stop_codon:yes gene_type:complete